MKTTRHAAILEIIEQQPVETQEELAEQLRRRGIVVTQATVSRDIKELRLVKVLSDKDGYRYAVSNKADNDLSTRLIRIFQETVVSMADAYNLIVVKTLTDKRKRILWRDRIHGSAVAIAPSATASLSTSSCTSTASPRS